MLSKEKILGLIEPLLVEKEFFLISLDISHSNSIRLVIDSMIGVTIEDCVACSRAIEHHLDREIEDFDIEVSSAGLTEPFKIKEQYLKNIGKEIEVILKTGSKLTGILQSVEETGFGIETEKKVRIEGKKRKQTIREMQSISFNECSKVKSLLKFK
jgi:ribosome maturation factor RimP